MLPVGNSVPICDGRTALLGITWVCVATCWQSWWDSVERPWGGKTDR